MGRPRRFNEDQLLEDAFGLFWRGGYHRTSLTEIAKRNRIERASLYNAYGTKETLFLTAYERYANAYLKVVVDALVRGETLEDKLMGYCRVSIDNFCEGEPSRSCPTTRGLLELDLYDTNGDDSPARLAFAQLIQRLIELITNTLSAAQTEGHFEGDPRLAAEQLVTMVRGLVILERAYASREDLIRIARGTVSSLLN